MEKMLISKFSLALQSEALVNMSGRELFFESFDQYTDKNQKKFPNHEQNVTQKSADSE